MCLSPVQMDSNWLDLKVHGDTSAKDIAQLSSTIADKIGENKSYQILKLCILFWFLTFFLWAMNIFKACISHEHQGHGYFIMILTYHFAWNAKCFDLNFVLFMYFQLVVMGLLHTEFGSFMNFVTIFKIFELCSLTSV